MNPAEKGAFTEAILTAELLRRCITVLKPVASHTRYDLVIELNGEFKKVQCKTGRVVNGAVEFNTNSVEWKTGRIARGRHYKDDIDYFLVYCVETSEVYLVPVGDVGIHHARLRIDPTRNKQTKKILWAKDFVI
jgi:hypothetical protein